jgi:hypothetical protein
MPGSNPIWMGRKEVEPMARSEILEVMEELYREGKLVKALDESGEPLLRKGQQVYKADKYATSAELEYWKKENKVRLSTTSKRRYPS